MNDSEQQLRGLNVTRLGLKDLSYAMCGGWFIVIFVNRYTSSLGKYMCTRLEVWKGCLVLRNILTPKSHRRNINGLGRESVPG